MKRVLLIEDNPTNRKLIREVLGLIGYQVEEAESAQEGIALALSGGFDLILMDIQLPGTDGLTATRTLREHAETRDIPIVAVTAHAMKGDEGRILEAGCDAYVAKPIAYKELLKTVETLLAQGRAGT